MPGTVIGSEDTANKTDNSPSLYAHSSGGILSLNKQIKYTVFKKGISHKWGKGHGGGQ